MARQNINADPSRKLFEAYMDFSGGLNSETSNERLRDNEFVVMNNVDLSSRGSARRRTGRVLFASISGNGQGMFFYYRQGQLKPDIILAVSGKLYVIPNGTSTPQEIKLTDGTNPFTFQTTLPIQAVQYGDDLFVATGTKLVEVTFDTSSAWQASTSYTVGKKAKANGKVYECTVAGTSGSTAPSHTSGTATDGTVTWKYLYEEWHGNVVVPYTPTVMEAIYIGTNGLADNPDAYIQDGISASLEVVGIKPAKRTGVVNQQTDMTAYINKPAGMSSVDYKWEYKKSQDSTWTLGQDFSASAKTWKFLPDTATDYDIRVTVRQTGTTTPTVQYALTKYVVNQTEDKTTNTSRPVDGIQKCRKIKLHWDRILLWGDDSNPFQLYISDLNNPRYFPVMNTISFDVGKQEPITSIVRYRDFLVIFTKTTIQTLVGKSPEDYRRSLIHDGLGCIAENSAVVTGNNIMFLSDEGIFMLRPNQFVLEVMNVQRADFPIKSAVPKDTEACAMVYDSQFWICFPSTKEIYRLYYDNAMWVRDKSSKLNFVSMDHYGSDVYDFAKDGKLYKHDPTVYSDDGEVYRMEIESKFFDLSETFNQKRLKRLYILGRHFADNIELSVKVFADARIALNPDSGRATVESGYANWIVTTQPNIRFYAGSVLGSWILSKTPLGDSMVSVQKASITGKCRRTKIVFVHEQDAPCEIFGFGLEFRKIKP